MRSCWAILAILVSTSLARAADHDRQMDAFLAIWSRNAAVTAAAVERLYARQVVYYGRPMSNAEVLRDKLAFVRRWPRRSYGAVPGTVVNDCTPVVSRCRASGLLRWQRGDASGRRLERGTNSVRLDLVREGGILKIARESGAPVR